MNILIHKADIHPWEDPDTGIEHSVLVCLTEYNGELYKDVVVPVMSFDEAYEIKKHCDTRIEPYVMEIEEGDWRV